MLKYISIIFYACQKYYQLLINKIHNILIFLLFKRNLSYFLEKFTKIYFYTYICIVDL